MCAEAAVGPRELLEGEAWPFHHDVVDGRLERSARTRDVVLELVESVSDGELRRDLRDRVARGLGGERARSRDARIHLDDDEASVLRVHCELNVRATGLDSDFGHHGASGVTKPLVLAVSERHRRRDRDRVSGVHAHRIEVFDRTDDDEVVGLVADDLELEFLPTEDALFDENLDGLRLIERPSELLPELFAIVGDAASRAPEREARPDDDRIVRGAV